MCCAHPVASTWENMQEYIAKAVKWLALWPVSHYCMLRGRNSASQLISKLLQVQEAEQLASALSLLLQDP